MTVRIDLPTEIAERVREEAERSGVGPDDVVLSALHDRFGHGRSNSIAELLAEWDREDATDDPAELESRRAELEEFKAAMNQNRPSERRLFP